MIDADQIENLIGPWFAKSVLTFLMDSFNFQFGYTKWFMAFWTLQRKMGSFKIYCQTKTKTINPNS